MRRAVRAALLAGAGWAVAVAGADPAGAQTFDLSILNAGKPMPDVEIVLLASGGKTPLGTTGADGGIAAPVGPVARGTPMEVYAIECDGEVVVVIVPASERALLEEECERRRAENPSCECRRIGAFLWGEGSVIDLGRRVVRPPGRPGPGPFAGPPANAPPVVVGLGGGIGLFPNLEDAVGDQPGLASTDAPSSALTLRGLFEYTPSPRLPLTLGLGGTYNRFGEFSQMFDPVAGGPSTSAIDFRSWGLDGYALWRPAPHRDDRLGFWFGLGGEYVWNEADFVTGFDDPAGSFDGSRSESGWMGNARIGFDWFFDHRAGIRFGAAWSRGASGSADERLLLESELLWLVKPWRGRWAR